MLAGIASIIAALAALVAAAASWRAKVGVRVVKADVATVHDEVREVRAEVVTANGKTIGMLQDAIEGRRAEAIAPTERTGSEQEHVDILHEQQRKDRRRDEGL